MKIFYCSLVAMVFLFSASVSAVVPGQVNFQGMLEDSSGQPVTGSVDFDFALFDTISAGTQIWSESQSGVLVSAGIYTVALGSVVPLVSEDLSGASVYLEITVAGETLSPRQRLLAVPYALTAQNAENYGGVSAAYFEQIFLHINYDGTGPANDDPLEGLADIDGDGKANFIDPDNDGDGLSDGNELNAGSDMNLVTPTIVAISAPDGSTDFPLNVLTVMSVTGNGFEPGFNVQVGPLSPTALNITSTSFDVLIGGGQVEGSASVIVTNVNAETATSQITFFEPIDKLVFVTSIPLADAMHQSVSVADAYCTQAAVDSGKTGSFTAWYSDTATGESVIDRMPVAGGAWQLVDGTVIATDLTDLTDGTVSATISQDEYGALVSTDHRVATNTTAQGLVDLNSCAGTSPANGYIGRVFQTNINWSHSLYFGSCTENRYYYCFEQ